MKIANKTLAVPDQIHFKLNSLDLSILESRGILLSNCLVIIL